MPTHEPTVPARPSSHMAPVDGDPLPPARLPLDPAGHLEVGEGHAGFRRAVAGPGHDLLEAGRLPPQGVEHRALDGILGKGGLGACPAHRPLALEVEGGTLDGALLLRPDGTTGRFATVKLHWLV